MLKLKQNKPKDQKLQQTKQLIFEASCIYHVKRDSAVWISGVFSCHIYSHELDKSVMAERQELIYEFVRMTGTTENALIKNLQYFTRICLP